MQRVLRHDIDGGYTAKLTNVQRHDGPVLQAASCACYRGVGPLKGKDACACFEVVDTEHGPRWREVKGTHADGITEEDRARAKADHEAAQGSDEVAKAQREMHERHGTADRRDDAGEDTVERARAAMVERHANAWRK